MTALLTYFAAWRANDAVRITQAVTADCTITECYGPIYRGRDKVERWARAWFAAGGVVHRWEVTDHFTADDREVAQWVFECTWRGNRSSFDGASVCRFEDGLVHELREYQATAARYEWDGTWR